MEGEESMEKLEVREMKDNKIDHMAWKITVKGESDRDLEEDREIIVNTWYEEDVKEYKMWLRAGEGVVEWKDLKNKVRNALPKKRIKKKTHEGKRCWNEKCKIKMFQKTQMGLRKKRGTINFVFIVKKAIKKEES